MAERDDLVRAIQKAGSGDQLAIAVAALDEHDRRRTAALAQSRELDMSASAVRATLSPLPAYERHTAATDWLGEIEVPTDYHTAMVAEAARWYRGIPRDLMTDPEEFQEQALGHAYTAAGKYGDAALDARRVFMSYVGFLVRARQAVPYDASTSGTGPSPHAGRAYRQAASGLPQIDQERDPQDNPAPTPYPAEVFDNFAPEQHPLNTAVESPGHQSQISSEIAPGIQELERQNAGGSGFGSGPERPATHTTQMDTADSYAEVPLGPPGQIPTAPGPMPSQPSSAPTPMGGQDQDEGAEQRRNAVQAAAYTRPDSLGYRWRTAAEVEDSFGAPYHERCGSLHWPEEHCGNGQAHTASVAVGYTMSAEDWSRRARLEAQGMAEGDLALRSCGSLAKLAAHHNAIADAFRAEARSEDEIAWLHGYLARVRPVLAQERPWSSEPGGPGHGVGDDDEDGDEDDGFGGKKAPPFGKGKKGKRKNASRRVTAGKCARCKDGDCADCSGGTCTCDHSVAKAGSRLDFPDAPQGHTAAMRKGAPFAGYEDFAACTRANSDKDDPDAYCGYIKHKTEDKGKKEGALIRLSARDLARANAELARLGQAFDSGSYSYVPASTRGVIPQHVMHDLWNRDPDGGALGREPNDEDRRRFRHWVTQQYGAQVHDAYFARPDEDDGGGGSRYRVQGASSLPQVQQTVDSHDVPTPQADELNTEVAFPLNEPFQAEWETGPGGAQPKGKTSEAARSSMTPSSGAVKMFGRMDAMEGRPARHKDGYPFSSKAHGQYTRGYAETRGVIDGTLAEREPMSKASFHEMTGRGDLHGVYLGAFTEARNRLGGGEDQMTSQGVRRQAQEDSARSRPHDYVPPPRDPGEMMDHMAARHGVTYSGDKAPSPRFLVQLHARFHDGVTADRETGGPHQHEGTGMDPVFGQRRTADFMTRPHQSTDDTNPPYNTAETTPDPWSSTGDADAAAGARDGAEDARNGDRATFADNSSMVSPYVKAYAEAYAEASQQGAAQDVPRSMGGDSGQPMNTGEAQTSFMVSKASLQAQAAQCYGCPHPAHRTEPCNAEGCRHLHNPGEEGAGPGMHARTIGHVPDPEHPGYSKPREGGLRRRAHDFSESEREHAEHSLGPDDKLPVNSRQDLKNAHTRAHQVKGESPEAVDAYLSKLDKEYGYKPGKEHGHAKAAGLDRISAAFITREAARDPDFRKGFKFAAAWRPGRRLVSRGSPAFEAGMYAAIADRPGVQTAWVAAHEKLGRRYRLLADRLDAHAGFTRKLALASPGRYRPSATGCYPVRRQAATSVDLITDGPGTSPDPMGSTPLNGPGTPPPMGGGENPARPGGVPPYQGAEPPGSPPVAPDDVVGRPQEAPQKDGPFTQTFSGRHPENTDLAPAAPNAAGGPGYENADAYQGDPRRQQAMAFRQRVQAGLASRRAG